MPLASSRTLRVMGKLTAYLSVTSLSGGVSGGDNGPPKSSSSCLAISMAAATPYASLGAMRCWGGTTTVGARRLSDSAVASCELMRLRFREGLLGTGIVSFDMIAVGRW